MLSGTYKFNHIFAWCLFSFLVFGWSSPVFAEDVVRIQLSQSKNDQRASYKQELLTAALDITQDDFGTYSLHVESLKMTRSRALKELTKGKFINLFTAPADKDWEDVVIPIRIPIRRGLLNYRLLLAHKDDVPNLSTLKTVEDLKQFSVGLLSQWTTTKIMRELGFTLVEVLHYDGLFSTLAMRRYHFTVRGINEVFGELEARKDELKDIRVVPDIAVKIPMPVYFYASPETPRLAERIKSGLNRLIVTGQYDKLFQFYFGKQIQQSRLWERRIIDVGNPLLPNTVPYSEKEYWYNPVIDN